MTDTDPFTDPPAHQMVTMIVSRQMTPGRDCVIHDGHEWQVADCWWGEVYWGGTAFGGRVEAHWMIEAVRRTDKAKAP